MLVYLSQLRTTNSCKRLAGGTSNDEVDGIDRPGPTGQPFYERERLCARDVPRRRMKFGINRIGTLMKIPAVTASRHGVQFHATNDLASGKLTSEGQAATSREEIQDPGRLALTQSIQLGVEDLMVLSSQNHLRLQSIGLDRDSRGPP